MSAPGAGEGISWVDVAASAAGIYRQMEQIGREAATGFANQFNANLAAPLNAALANNMRQAVTSAGAQIAGMQAGVSRAFAAAEAESAAAGGSAGRAFSTSFLSQAGAQNVGKMVASAITSEVQHADFRGIFGSVAEQAQKASQAMRVHFDESAREVSRSWAEASNQAFRDVAGAVQASSTGQRAGEEFGGGFRRAVLSSNLSELLPVALPAKFRGTGEESGQEFGGGFGRRLGEFLSTQRFEQFEPMWTEQFARMGAMASESFSARLNYSFAERLQSFRAEQSQFLDQVSTLYSQFGDRASSVFGEGFRGVTAQVGKQMRFEQLLPQLAQQFGTIGGQTAQAFNQAFGSRIKVSPMMADFLSLIPGWGRMLDLLGEKSAAVARRGVEQIDQLRDKTLKTSMELDAAAHAMGGKVYGHPFLDPEAAGQAASRSAQAMADAMKGPSLEIAAFVGRVFVDAMKNSFEFINKEFKDWGEVAKGAAETAMGAFTSVIEGKVPDFQAAFGLVAQTTKTAMETPLNAINMGIDSTVGHIPVIGSAFKAVAGEAQEAINAVFSGISTYTSIAGQFAKVLTDIGDRWQETARKVAGQTLGVEHLESYLEVVRDIAGSGELVHFKDVASVVGELSQRLSGLSNGAGLSRGQLTELATTLAEGNELLGDTKINVDNLTAAFNSFDVPAGQTNRLLTEFVNIARMTGADINELTRDLDLMSPALQATGLDAQDSAMMMGLLNQELGKPALGRYSFAFSHLVEQLNKIGMPMQEFVGIIQAYDLTTREGRAGAVAWVESMGLQAKAAENFVDQIRHGIIPTHEAMVDAFNKHGRALAEPFKEALEATKQLEDTMERLQSQVMAALAPLGEGLVGKLNEVGDHMSSWLQLHQDEFIGWVGRIAEKLLEWGAKITHFMADMLRDMSGSLQFFKNATVIAIATVNEAFMAMTAPFAKMGGPDPTGLVTAMKGINKATTDAVPSLKEFLDLRLDTMADKGADALDALGNKMEGLQGPLADLINNSKAAARVWEDFRAVYGAPMTDPLGNVELDEHGHVKRKAAELQDALGAVGDDMTIDPTALKQVQDQLARHGIQVDADTATGKIKKFVASTQEDLDTLQEYLNTRFGPDEFVKISEHAKIEFKVEPIPGKTPQQSLKDMGVAPELADSFANGGMNVNLYTHLFGAPPGTPGGPPKEPPAPPKLPGWMEGIEGAAQTGTALMAGPGAPLIWLMQALGDMSQYQHGGTVGGPGGTDRVPIWATAGEKVMNLPASTRFGPQLDWMNAQAFQTGGTVLDMAGIAPGLQGATGGIALPAGINVLTPQPMGEGDTMTRAGVPDKFQGDVVIGGVTSPGVAFPTALNVKEGEKKGPSEVMDSIGIPSRFQGSEGLDVPVKLTLAPGETLPSSAATTGAPASGAPAAPATGDVQNQVYAAMATGGWAGFNGGGYTVDPGQIPGMNFDWWTSIQSHYGTPHGIPLWGGSSRNQTGGLIGMASGGALGAGPLHGGAKTSLSYHSPSHLAPHVGLPGTSATYWKGMIAGGFAPDQWSGVSKIIAGSPSEGFSHGESGWSPNAWNQTDSNATAGDPSVGLGQLTLSNYRRYGFPNVHTPQDAMALGPYNQAVAMMNYIKGHAGSPNAEWEHWKINQNYALGGMVGMQPGGLLGNLPQAPGPGGLDETSAILRACEAVGLNPAVWMGPMKVLIGRESGGQKTGWWEPGVTQHGYIDVNTGINEAVGAAQVTPGTAAEFGVDPKGLRNPLTNLIASMRYIQRYYANGAPDRPRGKGGLGKNVPPDLAVLNVQQADSTMAPMGYQKGGLLSGFFKGILGELGFALPEKKGDEEHKSFWEMLTGNKPEGFNGGGHIKGNYWPGRDTVPMKVPPGTFIMNRNSSQNYADILDHILGVGPQGSYATGGMIPIIAQPGERVIPPGAAPAGLLHAMNQGTLQRRATGGGTGVLQVIYNPPNTREFYGEAAPYGLVGPGTSQPQYYNADWGGHHGHVHTSFETGPDGAPYGMPTGTNLPGTGHEHPEFASAGFGWVLALGRQYGLNASTYPGHQEHGGKNHGLDWWPAGKADMSGLSYTPEETDRLRRFASAMRSTGASGSGAWGGASTAGSYAGSYGSAAIGGSTRLSPAGAALRAQLKAVLPSWLSSALGMQGGGEPAIVPSPYSSVMGGDGPDDGGGGDRDAPAAPGDRPPPHSEGARAAADTPGAVSTRFGYYVYPSLDNLMGMTVKQAHDFIEWLHAAERAQENLTKDTTSLDKAIQDQINTAERLRQAREAVTGIEDQYKDSLAKMTAQQRRDWEENFKPYKDAMAELRKATTADEAATTAVTNAKRAQHDAIIDQTEKELAPAPGTKEKTTPDENAASMGAGLVKGMAQELGFGDVFAKPPWEWGIWKLFAGGASFALNLANMVGEAGGVGGKWKGTGGPGAGLGASGTDQAPGGAATTPAAGGPDASGVYTMPWGEKDIPSGGGYTYQHGDMVNRKGRWYPKDTAPAEEKPNIQPEGSEEPGMEGAPEGAHFLTPLAGAPPGAEFEMTLNGKRTRRFWGHDKKEIAPPASAAPPPGGGAGQLPGAGPGSGPPKGLPGMFPGSGSAGPAASGDPNVYFGGGDGGGGGDSDRDGGWGGAGSGGSIGGAGGILDWLEHPASLAIRQARAEGRLGPPPAANIARGMAASQPPAATPGAAMSGGNSLTVNQNIDPKPGDSAKNFIQSSMLSFMRAPAFFGGAGVPA
jgi:hypothetical protein